MRKTEEEKQIEEMCGCRHKKSSQENSQDAVFGQPQEEAETHLEETKEQKGDKITEHQDHTQMDKENGGDEDAMDVDCPVSPAFNAEQVQEHRQNETEVPSIHSATLATDSTSSESIGAADGEPGPHPANATGAMAEPISLGREATSSWEAGGETGNTVPSATGPEQDATQVRAGAAARPAAQEGGPAPERRRRRRRRRR
eukprot:CAMPEP_0194586884 /NCGR_PEP_ID=MMETSP0292-20121207/18739_1 /TAXON_ID=39354 /ORGANISM="Heterosigma akashiwo, Strain CCMP2393" /LENGTH=199 /DNA_ID=CAMNT_0039442859 /DNA_START=309 /DNA_END=904 /DNA_ORIENTATION=-